MGTRRLVLVTGLAFLVEALVLVWFPVFGVRPRLLPPLAALVGTEHGPERGAACGLLGGVFSTLTGASPFQMALLALAGGISGVLFHKAASFWGKWLACLGILTGMEVLLALGHGLAGASLLAALGHQLQLQPSGEGHGAGKTPRHGHLGAFGLCHYGGGVLPHRHCHGQTGRRQAGPGHHGVQPGVHVHPAGVCGHPAVLRVRHHLAGVCPGQVRHLWGGSGGLSALHALPCPGGGPVPDCHDGEDAPLLHPGRDGKGLHPHRLQPGLDPGGRPEKARPAQRHHPRDRLLGVTAAELVAGSIVVEQVFAVPGLGQLLLSSIGSRDFPVAQAVVILLATWVVVVNFIADVLYQYMDPRIRIR